ncbi:MAG: ATP-binding protein, partial [Acidimicrobiales bacterium]
RVVLISGEPGIGKTRLAEELAREAGHRGLQVAWGRAPDGEAAPAYWPWVQIIRTLAAEGEVASVQRALATDAEDLARLVPEVADLAGRELAGVASALSETARTRLYDAVVGFVLRLAADRPVVLAIDDLHWADWPTLQLVQLLAARLTTARVLLVATYREQDTGTSGPVVATLATLARVPDLLRIRLSGLAEESIALLLAYATGRDADPEVAEAIRARTEGNPFFVSELLQLLQASGQLAGTDHQIASYVIPLGVRDVVRQRLARLPGDSRSFLGPAAVAGREFDVDVVATAAGVDGDRALELVESALDVGVVVEDPATAGSYRFSHSIVRETIYDGLSALRRARLHRAIGLALARGPHAEDDHAAEIADHFLAASTAGDADEAYRWALRAADRAAKVLAFEQAVALLERAIQLSTRNRAPQEALRRELSARRRIAGVLLMKHWYAAPEVGEAWSQAAELCRRVDDSPDVLPCLWAAWSYRYVRGDLVRARELATEMLARAERTGDGVFDVVGNHCAGIVDVHLGRLREAGEHLRRVEAGLARLPSDFHAGLVWEPDLRSGHLIFRGLIECLAAGPEGARTLDESLVHARRLGRPLSVVAALFLTALGKLMFDDRRAAKRLAADGVAVSDEHGFRLFAAMMGVLRGAASSDPTIIRSALDEFEGTGSRMLLTLFWGLLAECERVEGRRDEALACVERALAEARSTGERFWEPELHRLQGDLLLDAGPERRSDAEACFLSGLALAREQGAHVLEHRIAKRLRRTLLG